ncbi:NAD(+) kinase [Acidihalobacter ferrooxydans]|uniref:NAD kinase n=1 Tax=Acidihalobacter ferrooxydans TaxID=1765967 RepID=A0A1P8UEH1_9GAMM|nr:NAD(+) kinase [Acidihalobacter ferrooxydans]APZ42231.1 NAD kinase [Acidihalobacter ferrooxydans]
MKPFQTIGIIAKRGDTRLATHIRQILQHLRERDYTVLLDESAEGLLPTEALLARETLAQRCDLAIVLGGDGTLLNAGRSLAEHGVALLGINLGRLGFLVDVSPARMLPSIDTVLAGHYVEESRALLHTEVIRDQTTITRQDSLNDVVLHNNDVVRMIEFDTFIDERFVNSQRADGLVVATPTGSTAYALSAGGPIVSPALPAILLVPICPHTLSNRPLVVGAPSTIEIVLCEHNQTAAQVAFDGQATTSLHPGDRIRIRGKSAMLRLLHPPDYDHFEILRAKLHWSETP